MSNSEDLHLFSRRTPGGRHTFEPDRPPCYQRALERASDQDRLFFAAHPEREEYVRRYQRGEFYPLLPANVKRVRVMQIAPGCRLRCPIIEGGAR